MAAHHHISEDEKAGSKIIHVTHLSCSPQLSMKLIMLINVKMPTIVGILTFISMINMLINVKMPILVDILTFTSMINTTSESLKARQVSIFQHFSFYEQLKFDAHLG